MRLSRSTVICTEDAGYDLRETRGRRVSASCKTRNATKGGAAPARNARKESERELQDTHGYKGRRGPPWPRAEGG